MKKLNYKHIVLYLCVLILIIILNYFIGSNEVFQKYAILFAIIFFLLSIFLPKIKLDYISIFILVCCMDNLKISFLGNNIKVYQILSLLLIFKMMYIVIFKKVNNYTNIDKYIYFWVISYFFAVPNIISMSDFKVVIFGQIYLIILYKAIMYNVNSKNLIKIQKTFLIGLIFIIVLGILQCMLHFIGINIGFNHIYVSGFPRPASLMSEPDWYGFICMINSIIMGISLLNNNIIFKKNIDRLIIITSLIGLFLSMTRTTWISYIIVMFIYFIFFSKARNKFKIIKNSFLIVILCFVILLGVKVIDRNIYDGVINRINPITSTKTDSGAFDSRKYSIMIMLDYIKKHPIVGNGVGSMNFISNNKGILLSYGIQGEINGGRGNANIFITNLFDTGIIGTILLLLFFITYLKDMLYIYKKTNKLKFIIYFMVMISIIVVFQMNNGIRFGFIWVMIGISMKDYNVELKLVKTQKNIIKNKIT